MMPKLKSIDDPIAEDWWGYVTSTGEERVTRVVVGRPCPIPGDSSGSWYCPIKIDDFAPMVLCAGGVGPVDALANAMVLAKKFDEEVGGVSPGARAPR